MAIIVDRSTRVVIQGITGSVGRVYAQRMLEHGTPLVAGVTPGRGGQDAAGIQVYNSVEEAVVKKGADCSLVVVPPAFVKDALLEAIDAGIRTIVVYTEGVPVHDTLYAVQYARLSGTRVIGPNSAGVVTPGECNVSDINNEFVKPGRVGIVSRSGTMTYEVMDGIFQRGKGVSTVACLGGDPVVGTRYIDVLKLFEEDDATEAVVLLGEIGGTDEVAAADYVTSMSKPIFAYVSGWSAPPGKRMGHAGAIVARDTDTASYKRKALEKAGAITAGTVGELVELMEDRL